MADAGRGAADAPITIGFPTTLRLRGRTVAVRIRINVRQQSERCLVSSCLFCHYGIPQLDVPIGTPGDPVGLCVRCYSLCCGWHGARTRSPAFLCLVCDINDLFASAGWDAFKQGGGLQRIEGAGGPAGVGEREAVAELAWALATAFSTASGEPSPLVVATLTQWFADRPSYSNLQEALAGAVAWAVEMINRDFQRRQEYDPLLQDGADYRAGGYVRGAYDDRTIQALWKYLGDHGRRLLAAAVLLVITFELPLEFLPPPAVAVSEHLARVLLRDYSDQIAALRARITGSEQR